jgi:ABC-2 type transport system permease protein
MAHERALMSGLMAVARRELQRLRQLPLLWALLGPIPAAMTLLLVGVFASEVVRDLPVAVLDLDRSATSRTATRWVEAIRSARLAAHVEDLGAARSAILERQVYGVLVVPRHFERDLLRGRSPHVSFLFNDEYLTAGGNVSSEVSRGAATAAALLTALSGRKPTPIQVDSRSLFNPAGSYAQALGFLLIGGLLQVVIGLATIYAVGRELTDKTVPEWLETARGSTAAAWLGKLGPYTVLHCLLVWVLLGAFAEWYGIPIRGPAWLLVVATVGFVLASQAFSLLIIAWTANLRVSLGAGAVILGPAAAFGGVTFPLTAMPVGARGWALTLPLTHGMALVRAGITVGAPEIAGGPLLALALTAAIALGLAMPRLPALLRNPVYWGRL